MINQLQKVVDAVWNATHKAPPSLPAVHDRSADMLSPSFKTSASSYDGNIRAPAVSATWDGDKFPGGFGVTELLDMDYWTLRQRSAQLFRKNLYARGLIARLVTNEINTGLMPEATPDEDVLGVEEDSLNEWTDEVESRWGIWTKNPSLCDWQTERTFGAIQRVARMEALISGDVLVIIRQSKATKLPMVQLVDGQRVQSPLFDQRLDDGNYVKQGIEFDANDRRVAFWIRQAGGTFKRIVAWTTKGRRNAYMVYGLERRVEDCRGEPLLSVVLQSLKEIDRYRDSAQRQAVVNSILAMFIVKNENKQSSLPVQGGAVRKSQVTTQDSQGTRKLNIAEQIPGVVYEELQQGEEPKFNGGQGTDVNFGEFEEAIIQAVAWANEIPPEILRLAFSNNYSASQAAINEFKIYLNKIWSMWGEEFCTPVYIEWLLSETLLGKIDTPGLLESWRNPQQYDIFGALISADWYGAIKPSTDMLKQAKGSKMLVEEGWSTNAREARITTGTKFKKNIKRLKRENELKTDAARPLAEFKQEFGSSPQEEEEDSAETVEALENLVNEILEERGINA